MYSLEIFIFISFVCMQILSLTVPVKIDIYALRSQRRAFFQLYTAIQFDLNKKQIWLNMIAEMVYRAIFIGISND